MICGWGCSWTRGAGSAWAIACGLGEGGTLDAGRTPSKPFPVPWFAGCGGISIRAASTLMASALFVSALLVSALLVSALATTALDVSGTSGRAGGMALVMAVTGWAEPAEASVSCPALTWTVLTLTGFMGSDEPGMAAIDCVWITPLVRGAGSGLACVGGTAAAASAITDRVAGAAGQTGDPAAGTDESRTTLIDPLA